MAFKEANELTPDDLQAHPVWEYVSDLDFVPESDEDMPSDTAVMPVRELPVRDTANRIIGAKVRFHNKMEKRAVFSKLGTVTMFHGYLFPMAGVSRSTAENARKHSVCP